jgi:hypothetical protein
MHLSSLRVKKPGNVLPKHLQDVFMSTTFGLKLLDILLIIFAYGLKLPDIPFVSITSGLQILDLHFEGFRGFVVMLTLGWKFGFYI